MAHMTKIIKMEQVSDEAVTVTVRCCDDPHTDSVLTIYGIHNLSATKLDEYINKHHDNVAAKCKGMGLGKDLLSRAIAKTKKHED